MAVAFPDAVTVSKKPGPSFLPGYLHGEGRTQPRSSKMTAFTQHSDSNLVNETRPCLTRAR